MGKRSQKGISRREFARRAAMASAAALVRASALPENASPASAPASQPVQPGPAPQLSPESRAEAEARYQAVLGAYGSRLSDAQKADLHRMSLESQPALDRLRACHLENSDNPALYLKPLVEREKKSPAPLPAATGSKKP